MKYPKNFKQITDITKEPYFADNTGKNDCTAAICKAFDDCLKGYADGLEKMRSELLNDNSEITADGFKVDGPGMLVCGINGGKTRLNLFNAAWWGNKLEDNSLFKLRNSSLDVTGGIVFCYNTEKKYQTALDIENGEFKKSRTIDECLEKIMSADEFGRDNGVPIRRYAQ